MSQYSKEYIKEQLKSFTQKELTAFKKLVQEFNYPVDKAFEKVMAHRKKLSKEQKNVKSKSEVVGKNEGGQNIIKPVDPEEFELIGYKDEITPPPPQKRTKDLSNEEIIPVLDPKEKELESLSPKARESYDKFISLGMSHEDALKRAYQEAKKETLEKLQHLTAFYGVKED